MVDIKKEQERDELHRAIWAIADELRGSIDGWDFKSYVLGMMFYRYISENLTNYINEGEIEAVQTLYQTNLFGPIELIKAVLPKMREQKSGYILNVTSIAAARSAVGSGYYASSKAALELLTNGLMKELAPLGIKAMVVQPGAFRTRFYDGESLQGTKAQIGDYEAVVGKSRPGNFENKHQQAGDPDKAGKVIVDVVHNDDLPEILTLGKAAVTAVKSTLEAKIAELDKWAEVSASCDYEEGK